MEISVPLPNRPKHMGLVISENRPKDPGIGYMGSGPTKRSREENEEIQKQKKKGKLTASKKSSSTQSGSDTDIGVFYDAPLLDSISIGSVISAKVVVQPRRAQ